MPSQHIQAEQRDGVLKLTLDRPDVLNSFNARMAEELTAALDFAARDATTRAVLLTGIGRGFCAGQDLAEVMPDPERPATDLGEVVARQYNPIIRAIRFTEKPFICAVNGVAAGAGANIAFACDLVIAAEGATFIQSFAKIGLIPDSGGTWMLPRLVGLQRATWLAMMGEKIDANRARVEQRELRVRHVPTHCRTDQISHCAPRRTHRRLATVEYDGRVGNELARPEAIVPEPGERRVHPSRDDMSDAAIFGHTLVDGHEP